jgi:MYXO-CTERM domain-containing protein
MTSAFTVGSGFAALALLVAVFGIRRPAAGPR